MINNYLKLALKVLGRRKFFTFISLFGISLTLVVLMVATAVLDNAFAPRAPESRFDRTLVVYSISMRGPDNVMNGSPGYGFVDRYVRGLPGAEAISVFSNWSGTALYQQGQKIETHIKRTDGPYWQILDFHFVEGGPYTQADDDAGNHVAVITDDLRSKLFAGAPAVGRTVTFEGQNFRVVGVVKSVPITRVAGFSEIWVPIHTMKRSGWEKQMLGQFNAMVLARSPHDIPKLRAAFAERLSHFVFDDPRSLNQINAGLDTTFEAFVRSFFGTQFAPGKVVTMRIGFLVAALLFITLPTLNLVSINLSRIMERASEIGVRKAFGASSRALVGQFVTENIVLSILGGLVGFVLSAAALSALAHAELLPYAVFDVNFRIFGYGMLIAVLFGCISGVYPAWRMSRMHPVNALRGGAQ